MPVVRCQRCDKERQVRDATVRWSSFVKCKCGGKAYVLSETRQQSGDKWRRLESVSRAIQADQVEEQRALDKERGVDSVVDWVPDGRGMALPKFKSMFGRRKWDRAYQFHDADSYFG